MQSQDGDVQLSVTLDTSGLKKETEKIKAEIEAGVKSAGTDIKPTADVKPIQQVAKSADEASHEFQNLTAMADALSERLSVIQEQLENLKKTAGENTEEYHKLLEEVTKIKETLELANQLKDEILSSGQYQYIAQNIANAKQDTEDTAAEMDRLQGILDRNRQKAEELANELAQAADEDVEYIDPDSMKYSQEATEFVRKFNEEAQSAEEATQQLTGDATKRFADEYERFVEYIQAAEAKAQEMAQTISELKDIGVDPEALQKMESEYDALINKIALMRQSIQMGSAAWNEMQPKEKLVQFAYKLKTGFTEIGNSILEKAVPAFQKFLASSGNLIKSSAIKGLRTITALFKKLTPQINASNKGLALGLKRILGYVVGISSLVMLFNKLRAAAKEGINNLAQWKDGNNAVNDNLSTLISYLLQLKNQLAAAFAPIVTTVVPILNTFIDSLIEATNYLAQFLAKLTGQATWIKATRVQKNYADSLRGTGKAASDANGKLAKFDDLDILNDKGGAGGIDPNDMFEEMPIDKVEENVESWVEKLQKAWETADFTDIGGSIGSWIKDSLDSVPWNDIKDMAKKIAHSLATLLNGFFEVEKLGSTIGSTLANAFGTAFAFLNEFVHTLHWDSIGKFIGDSLVTFIKDFPWQEAGEALGGALVGMIDLAYNTVKTFTEQDGWGSLVEGITTFITNFLDEMNAVDEDTGLTGWQKMGETIYMTVHGILTSLTDLINEMPIDDIMDGIGEAADSTNGSKLINDFIGLAEAIMTALSKALKKIDWAGVGDAIGQMLNGIISLGDELLDLAGTIIVAIAEALVNSISTLNESHPLVVDLALLIGAALALINSGMIPASSIAAIKNMLALVLGGVGSVAFTIGSVVILGIATAKIGFDVGKLLGQLLFPEDKQLYVDFKWKDFINEKGLKETLSDIFDGFVLMTNDMFSWIDDLAIKMFDGAKSILDGFVKGLDSALTWVGDKWNAFWDDLIFWFKECWGIHSPSAVMEGFGENIIQGLINGIESMKDKLLQLWDNIKTSVAEKVTAMKDGIMTKIDTFKLNFLAAFVEIKSKIVSIWTKIKDALKTPVNAILAGIETMVNGFIDGINKMIDAINKIGSVKVPDWAKKFGIDDFSVNIQHIQEVKLPRLAQGAVIPPNREFMAVLGDQTQGTNIEAPLDTITQAFADVVGSMRTSGDAVMQVDGQTFARLMVPYVVNELSRRGYNTKILEA